MVKQLPSRPFGRTHGSLDAFVANIATRHIGDEAAPGIDVDIGGWITDPEGAPVGAAWVDIAGVTMPVVLDRKRPDVARAFRLSDSSGSGLGFTTTIQLPADMPAGTHDARVVGRTATGQGVYGESLRRVVIAQAQVAPRRSDEIGDAPAATLRVGDTQSGAYTLGRGAETIRAESSLRLRGRVPGATRLHVTATPPGGNATAWEFPCGEDGRFDAILWTADLERGLYTLAVATCDDDGRVAAVRWCEIAIAGPHHLPPLHLGLLRTSPDAGLVHYADASPRSTPDAGDRCIAGHPIAVAGWCIDPVAQRPALAVYVAVDERRPVPIAHHLPDPRPAGSEARCGFGGIIDTSHLDPGPHRVRILGAAVSGTGWYVVDERTIDLADHSARSTVTVAAPPV